MKYYESKSGKNDNNLEKNSFHLGIIFAIHKQNFSENLDTILIR
jgi:hypothetical protein